MQFFKMHFSIVFLVIGSIQLASSVTDFKKVNFIQSFKDAEQNGGLSPLEMQAILEAHNTFRRDAAKGKRTRLPTAAGLTLLEWDDRLAYEAQLWLDHLFKTQTTGHPSVIDVHPWGYCGQNLGFYTSTSRNMYKIMRVFELEIDYYTFDTNTCVPGGSYYTCGHAKQLYSERTTHVGCQARRRSADPANTELMVVCNYGRIATGEAPYTKGTPCSACKGSYPYCLDGLCASKKVCELAGMDKCKCTKTDSDCGNGASVDPTTCQCTKNCPADWVSPYCKSKCDDGEGMEPMCPMLYADPADCVGTINACAKFCGNCVDRVSPVAVAKASNLILMESYPRAKDCEDATGLDLCATTNQEECSGNIMIAAACARTCNRCRMLDGVTNWSKQCTEEKVGQCANSALFRNVCQKLCAKS